MTEIIKEFFTNLPSWVGGFAMAVVISVLRVIYEKEETTFTRIMLESLICGALTIASGSALQQMGYGENWYLFCGGVIGFMGSQSVRLIAYSIIRKKTGTDDTNKN